MSKMLYKKVARKRTIRSLFILCASLGFSGLLSGVFFHVLIREYTAALISFVVAAFCLIVAVALHYVIKHSILAGAYDSCGVMLVRVNDPFAIFAVIAERIVPFEDIVSVHARYGAPLSALVSGPVLEFVTRNGNQYVLPLLGRYREQTEQFLNKAFASYLGTIDIDTSVTHVFKEEDISVLFELPPLTPQANFPTRKTILRRQRQAQIALTLLILGFALMLVLGTMFPNSAPIQAVYEPVLRFFEG